MHNCPVCGELTEGAISEGGIKFAICEQCYQDGYQQKAEERENY